MTTTIAVVGLGYWGPNIVRNLADLPEAEVGYVCDIDARALADFERRYPVPRGTTSYQQILDDPGVDAIAIATPVSSHYQLALGALRAGKHVFVEKPLAGSMDEAVELIDLATENGLVLMPGHTFLYSPPVNVIRDLIASGELGEIYFVSTSRVNLGLYQPDVSVAWDLGPHDFSILRYWLDDLPTRAAAWVRGCVIGDIPDVAFINLEFPSGTLAHVELSWLAPSKLRRTVIVGSKRMVVYDDTSTEPVRIYDSGVVPGNPESFGEFQLSYRSGDVVSPRVDAAEPLRLEMIDFCRAVRTGSEPRSSWSLGLDVIRMVESVELSAARGGVPVAVGEPVA
jgi:predicted dehydrogenase